MWSKSGEGIDYYFLYGPEIDRVIGGYRTLTGRASMLPDWAFGFWQSKNKYNTQNEVLEHAGRVSPPRDPNRHHRAGLAVPGRPIAGAITISKRRATRMRRR